MAETADDVLRAIGAIHKGWLNGEISQEDALFQIGDLLDGALRDDAQDPPAPDPPLQR